MAIQINYPFIDAVSVSLSASRGSPARLFTVGGSVKSIPFNGSLIGTGSELGVGRNFTINEFIDGSVYLDKNNIILFRRGMPSSPVIKTKRIVVPIIVITGGASGARVLFADREINVEVQRLRGSDTLGQEDWADSPCAGSQTRYLANEALGIIGAPSAGNFWCSYEGQYRSVLSSIYSDIGCSYWWNFSNGGLGKICSSSGGNKGQKKGCNIISSVNGSTKDGTRTHSSFTYIREPVEEIRSVGFTKTFKDFFIAESYNGASYPTQREIERSLWDGIDTYRSLSAGVAPPEYIDYGTIRLPSISSADLVKVFNSKFNWNLNKSNAENWSNILGLPDVRTDTWGNVSSADDVSAGILRLVKSAQARTYRRTQLELFYPYSELSIEYPTNVSAGSFLLQVKNSTLQISPNPSARGYNGTCGSSVEDVLGNKSIGLWRGVQIYSPDDTQEGIGGDFSNFGLSLQLQESIADCVYQVNVEPFLFLETINIARAAERSSSGAVNYAIYMEGNMPGTWRYMFKRGYAIIWLRPPRRAVSFSYGGTDTNCNDLSEVVGYKDPNLIVTQTPPRDISDDKNNLPSICDSAVQSWLDNYGVYGEDDEGADVEIVPGLIHANGTSLTLSAGGESKRFVMPSLSDYQVARTLSTQYEFQAKFDTGKVGKGTWASKGSTSGGGMSHTVSVTDVTPGEDGDYQTVPNSNGDASPIGYSKYTATDFCCPIDGTLESLNANINPDGVSVSYSYRGLSPLPGTSQIRTSTKGISRGFVSVGG